MYHLKHGTPITIFGLFTSSIPSHMNGNLCQVSEEATEKSGDILRKCLHWAWAVPSMSDYVMQRLVHIVS